MNITQSEAIAKSKNNLIDIPSLGAELRAAHDKGLSTSSDDARGWDFGGITDKQRDALLAAHEGVEAEQDEPVTFVRRAGKIIAKHAGGEQEFSPVAAAVERIEK